jgi:hypothetical protein
MQDVLERLVGAFGRAVQPTKRAEEPMPRMLAEQIITKIILFASVMELLNNAINPNK